MDEQRGQRLAADRRHSRRPPDRSGADNPLRRRRQEKMGGEFSFHGVLRLCLRPNLLGRVGVQNGVRG